MRKREIAALFEYNDWANRQMVASAGEVPVERFVAGPTVTYRGLRGTLVHVLDVERSWRLRILGEPMAEWDVSLPEDEFPSASALGERWAVEESERRAWLETLDDLALARPADLGPRDRFPLWQFLAHVLTHSAQQRRDAAIALDAIGHTPPEIEFLYYADSLGA